MNPSGSDVAFAFAPIYKNPYEKHSGQTFSLLTEKNAEPKRERERDLTQQCLTRLSISPMEILQRRYIITILLTLHTVIDIEE